MNEKLQYATMLDIPVNTCSISVKPTKKRNKKKKVNAEQVKEQLLSKINSQEKDCDCGLQQCDIQDVQGFEEQENSENQSSVSITHGKARNKKTKLKFSAISLQLIIIGLLIATIFITNSIYPNSGLNVFMRGVFGTTTEEVDAREYSEFSPTITSDMDGTITMSGEGSVYSSEQGVVSQLLKEEDGTFTVEIEHSEKFKSVYKGLQFVYAEVGQEVYQNIPFGYVSQQASMCFKGENDAIISNFQIQDGYVIWTV